MKKGKKWNFDNFKLFLLALLIGGIFTYLRFITIRIILEFIAENFAAYRFTSVIEKYYIPHIVSFCSSLFTVLCIFCDDDFSDSANKPNGFEYINEKHFGRKLFINTVIFIACQSIRSKANLDPESIYKILSATWTCTGIIMTVFSIWIAFTNSIFQKKKTTNTDNQGFFKKYKELKERISYHGEVEVSNALLILIIANILLLTNASFAIYLMNSYESVFIQNFVRLSFITSLTTLWNLVWNIFNYVWEERSKIKEENDVSKADLDRVYNKYSIQHNLESQLKEILANDELSDEEKEEMSKLVIASAKEMCSDKHIPFTDVYEEKE